MRSSHSLDRVDTAFDDDHLVADAGLLLPATLAHRLDLRGLVDKHVSLGGKPGRANVGDKFLTLVTSALAGGDCIDDANALRAGGTERVLGFTIKAARVMQLTRKQAEEFYVVHRGRPFYAELVAFMSSAPCMPLILKKPDAVVALRDAIGATDPAEAAAGTVRKLFAESKGKNAIHASDSDENAVRESRFFFAEAEVI